ncbi:hypothetical protein J32TS2_39870 [Shouchella clausii]|nr:hypothetical protein J32TS2_39870 [Shouchella clausii]
MKLVFSFIIIFVAGFILGKMDTKLIINKIGHEIVQLNIVSIIGLISSITTLLVFLMYIVGGKYMLSKKQKCS